ncbi:HlyD family secretion protein [Candidatus Nitrotoga sp. M5]|uniref:HlyD family secretion protein n=1 Tax=Candidatus Nitrotoga sp. M5 TaxID=2890409 RepID=UPI001EF6D558|nr:HlyD family secretion protein [Candidatus Nitrotoga sp. M5]CAH1387496.1 Membrane fusion protein, multidrug efflux system [Candidatus Nitrotoga sp. M5]
MVKLNLKIMIIVCVALPVCAVGVYNGFEYWVSGRYIVRTDNAYVRSDIVAIASKVSGYIVEVAVADNQYVEAGDPLFRIDPEDYEARHAQSLAALDEARAARARLIEERTLQGALINEARAGIDAAQAEAELATSDRKRSDKLVKEGWSTRQRHEFAIANETHSRAGVEQAKAGLAAQQERLSVLTAEAKRLDAVVDQASAKLRLADIALNDTVVLAPVSGVIGNRHLEAGQYARPGVPMVSIVPLHNVWIEANFKEDQLVRMAPGQPVTVYVDAFGRSKFTGHIDSLAPASGAEFSLLPPDNATGNFIRIVQRIPVKILLNANFQERLLPGMSAEVQVDTRGAAKRQTTSVLDIGTREKSGFRNIQKAELTR